MTHDLRVRIVFAAGNAFASDRNHATFAKRLFAYSYREGVDLVAGTEANASVRNNLARCLHDYGPEFGYAVRTHPETDGWIAVHHGFGFVQHSGFEAVVPAVHRPASQGGHGPRGVFLATVKPDDDRLAPQMHLEIVHLVTHGTDPSTLRGQQNTLIVDEAGANAVRLGGGTDLVFAAGDMNTDDQHRDAWRGNPLTSCWDELGKWPTTHPHPDGGGPTLDQVASYDGDKRTRCIAAHTLKTSDVDLPSDHRAVLVDYAIAPRHTS